MSPAEKDAEIRALREALADEISRKRLWRDRALLSEELSLIEGARARALEETVGVLLEHRRP